MNNEITVLILTHKSQKLVNDYIKFMVNSK